MQTSEIPPERLHQEIDELRARLAEQGALLAKQSRQLAAAQEMLQSLREGPARFPEENPAPVLCINREGIVLYANPSSAVLCGGWKCEEGCPAPESFARLVRETLDDGQPRQVDVASGSRDFSFLLAPIADSRYVNLYGRDISDHKQMEAERQQFVSLADQSTEFIGMCDMDFMPFYINEAGRRLVGLDSLEQALQTPVKEFFFPDDQPFIYEEFFPRVLREGRAEVEIRFRHFKTGEPLWMIYNVFFIRDAEGKPVGLATVSRDITERKRAEESVLQAKAAAEQANRAKDHFLAVLSHELRTPLTPVVMGVSMLQNRSDLAPDVLETLEMIGRSIDMEARLIDDLLDVSRIARGKIELHKRCVDICPVIRQAAEVCKPDVEARRLCFGVDMGPAASYWVEGDASRLQQVFWNLLKNAIKFTPHGGCVGIRCRPDQERLLIEVNDSGIGIERDALTRVFNAFEQEERSITRQFGGLGLGLAISKTLVEMHGGTIEARSDGRNKGATFRIRLPLTSPAAQQAAQTPTVAPPAVRSLRVLLVEDHPVTAKMMQTVLIANGHAVQWASDIAVALELAARNDFDLLMSDLGLPDGSGHDLMRQLRERGHTFAGVALSGYGQEEDIQRSREAGFAAHLTKPASREAVLEAIVAVTADASGVATNDAPATSRLQTPVFDAAAALRKCLDQHDILAEMIRVFHDDVDTLLPQIHSALQRGDMVKVGELGHRMKGTIVYLAAEPAREAALRVERAGKLGKRAEAEATVEAFARECQLLRAALCAYRAPPPHD